MYTVKEIEFIDELYECPIFHIDNHMWIKDYKPKSFGRMAFIKNEGIVVSMTTMEKSPLTRYVVDDDPVYKDSAMEAFFDFKPNQPEIGYFNFEMNSNAAMLSGFGLRPNRKRIKAITNLRASCSVIKETNSWSVLLKVPMELICEIYQIPPFLLGDEFSCNFYKISEDPSIEHYVSYSPIDSPTPNFHMPEFFAKAVIVK